jgi:hypothetical protein
VLAKQVAAARLPATSESFMVISLIGNLDVRSHITIAVHQRRGNIKYKQYTS